MPLSVSRYALVVLFTVLFATPAGRAAAQHGDVTLFAENGGVGVGLIEESTSTITPGVRVFEAILTPDALPFSPFDYSAAEPGFDVLDGAMPANQTIALTPVAVGKWNGAGFDPVAGVLFDFFPNSGLATDAEGGLHEHRLFGLTDLTLDPLPLADGVYRAAFRAGTAGLADSPLIHFVLLKDELIASESDAEAVELLLAEFENGGPDPIFAGKNFAFFAEAVEFAESAVPEPGSASLASLAAIGLVAGRRWT